MTAPAFARGCFGDLVAVLQTALQHGGFYTSTIDADYGNGTQTGVSRFQAEKKMAVSGRADADTWSAVTGMAWPELFERCLQLTARFEGTGYQLVEGNYDGAGLTWGIVGFTLASGEIQELIQEIALKQPDLLTQAFGDRSTDLLTLFRSGKAAAQMSWANQISSGNSKTLVAEPWRSGFQALGRMPLVRQLQREHARRDYFMPAMAAATALGFGEELSIALLFDIHVQNGGVKKADKDKLLAAGAAGTEADRRVRLAQLVAASTPAKWRADVVARKNALASGQGVVHGQNIDTNAWGLSGDA